MLINIILRTLIFLSSVSFLGFMAYMIIRPAALNFCDIPLFFVLGAGTYTFYEVFFSFMNIQTNISHFLFLMAVLLMINIYLYFRYKKFDLIKAPSYKKTGMYINIIVVLLVLAPLFINMIMAMAFPQFDIDMLAHILMKARLFTTDTYRTSVFLHDDIFANVHSRYPPFTGIFLNLFLLFGCDTVSHYQVLNYSIFALTALSIFFYFKDKIALWQGMAWVFIFISTAPYISSQFIMDSTDILLSLYFLLGAVWFLRYHRQRRSNNLVMCLIILGFSTLVKNEALVFSAVLISIMLWLHKREPFKYLWIWFIIALPWLLYRNALPDPLSSAESMLRTANIIESTRHIKHALGVVFSVLLKEWNSIFILWFPSLFILYKSRHKKDAIVFSIVIISLIFVYAAVIWLHIGKEAFYRNGFFRTLCHIYPFAIICLAFAALELYSINRKQCINLLKP